MIVRRFPNLLSIVIFVIIICLLYPPPASADGGIIIPDPELWSRIDERQQVAVIQLTDDDTAQVDLFISMVNNTSQPHEVTYFLPLGIKASEFKAEEKNLLEFDRKKTEELDKHIREYSSWESEFSGQILQDLLLSWIPINGIPAIAAVPAMINDRFAAMTGASIAVTSIATHETANSHISIYELNTDTDIQALVEITNLNSSASESLNRYRGQQVAVLKLKTQPQELDTEDKPWIDTLKDHKQHGIHISWVSTLIQKSEGLSYEYPLGTGSAWANPIELTRVYIIAEPGVDFQIHYPMLGEDIDRYFYKPGDETPSYSMREAYGDFGRVWRVTYYNSNSAQDIVITQLGDISSETRAALRSIKIQEIILKSSLVIGLVVAFTSWLLSWRWVMNRFLNRNYHWRSVRLWKDAFGWLLLYHFTYLILIALFALFIYLFTIVIDTSFVNFDIPVTTVLAAGIVILSFTLLCLTLLGLVNAFIFSNSSNKKFQEPRFRAFGSYLLVMLLANLAYFAFSLGYSFIVGVWRF